MSVEAIVVVSGSQDRVRRPWPDNWLRPSACLIAKDTIKEALFDSLGSGDPDWAAEVGRASHRVMLALAPESAGAVVEAFFWPGVAEPELLGLGRPLVQVWCRCPVELALQRYRRRIADPDRHSGHRPAQQDAAATSRWVETEPVPLAIEPLITVDTDGPVDCATVVSLVQEAMAA